MFAKIRNLVARPAKQRTPKLPPGQRVYAVGDIHGRLDLFEGLIAAIERDDAARGEAVSDVILLGDLIDRGPASAGVIDRARRWSRERRVEFIQGNHEEMLLVAARKLEAFRSFLKFGGRETIISYGVDPDFVMEAGMEELQLAMLDAIPQDDFDFLDSFEKMVRIGDYLFVHAGVRPDTPLDHQLGHDCRWIREPFLTHDGDFGAVVVHGHTITEAPEIRANRIGIDTGAYIHGTLTAIGLEGENRWFIQARDEGGGISIQIAA
ncbi:serine/threonine protein phosphatase 1 [Novosphingobium sp. PhB165]|uniref:metallophosphoesterase n=1 Tax=Novosphingobium sp. PhB165 TaxID=2485105 RepID=UPI001045C6F2|nr:metallophosphoesterase [Novosphingobium sp. PhB165]TCM19478.1 serine/threonine protein phosphatase 1 [Novosphingobium sp. PhB165]